MIPLAIFVVALLLFAANGLLLARNETSQLVIDEAGMGDSDAAAGRLKMLDGIPILPVNTDTQTVADEIICRSMMPTSARIDALHIATAALAGVQYTY